MQPEFDAEVEPIYELPPEVVQNQYLRDLYAHIVRRLHIQAAASGNAEFNLFMIAERMAFTYIVLRQKEMNLNGISWIGNQQVALNRLWIEYSREFNAAVRKPSDEEFREKMKKIIFDVISSQDPPIRRKLANDFSSAFEREQV